IESVTNTGTCLRPSCTAIVWPIMAGTIIERRDHVLITLWEPLSFSASTFFIRWPSTNGPFLRLRGIGSYSLSMNGSALLAGSTAADDLGVAGLALAARTSLGLAPGADRVATTRGLALATTVWMVDRVHDHAADGRALALPPHAAGLAPVDVGLLGVADLADRGAAADIDEPHLARGQPQRGARALLGDQLRGVAGRTGDLGTAAGAQLDAVDRRADRDVAQREVVAHLDVGVGAGLEHRTLTQVLRRHDVALLAVHVVQQRDPGGAGGGVLDVRDLRRDAVLVVATEVDDPVGALVAAALVTGGDPTLVVAAALLGQGAGQRLLRRGPGDLDEVGHRGAAAARGGRLVLADSHVCLPLKPGQETGPPKMSMR